MSPFEEGKCAMMGLCRGQKLMLFTGFYARLSFLLGFVEPMLTLARSGQGILHTGGSQRP